MKKYRNVGIVFGGGINGLGLARNLGRNGVCIYCVVDSFDEAIYSRYCKKFFVIRDVQEKREVLKSFLDKLGKKLGDQALLLPATDLFCVHLSELKDELEDDYFVLLPDADTVKTLVEKKRFYASLTEHGVPHPTTFLPKSVEDVKEISKKIEYPVFIRPSVSQIFSRAFGKKGFIATTGKELVQYYVLASKSNTEMMLQEVIPGSARNVYGIAGYFDRNSHPKAFFAYHRLRVWPPIIGNSSLMESIPVSEIKSTKEVTRRYLYELGYHGIMDAEFKRDPRDGVYKLLEINARSWWQNSFPTKCGINVVLIAYLDSIGKEIQYTEDYKAGLKWVHVFNDLRSSMRRSDMTMGDWILSLNGIKDWPFFSVDDPAPWIVSNLNNAKAIAKEFLGFARKRKV